MDLNQLTQHVRPFYYTITLCVPPESVGKGQMYKAHYDKSGVIVLRKKVVGRWYYTDSTSSNPSQAFRLRSLDINRLVTFKAHLQEWLARVEVKYNAAKQHLLALIGKDKKVYFKDPDDKRARDNYYNTILFESSWHGEKTLSRFDRDSLDKMTTPERLGALAFAEEALALYRQDKRRDRIWRHMGMANHLIELFLTAQFTPDDAQVRVDLGGESTLWVRNDQRYHSGSSPWLKIVLPPEGSVRHFSYPGLPQPSSTSLVVTSS